MKEFSFILPKVDKADQGKEKIIVTYKGETRELLTHDYGEIYKIPGLYENLFYDTLACQSPKVVCGLLEKAMNGSKSDSKQDVALDVGAGNGMVGEELAKIGFKPLSEWISLKRRPKPHYAIVPAFMTIILSKTSLPYLKKWNRKSLTKIPAACPSWQLLDLMTSPRKPLPVLTI